jgi:hypothetical protein
MAPDLWISGHVHLLNLQVHLAVDLMSWSQL